VADAPAKPDADPAPEAPAKKKPPIKLIGIVATVMIVEGAGVFFVVSKLGNKPAEASAKAIHGANPAEAKGGGEHGAKPKAEEGKGGGEHGGGADAPKDPETPVELAVVSEKFQNMTAGIAWMWDAEIFVQVKAKNEKLVKDKLKAREAEVKEGISLIFRKATLNQLKEPGLETLNRQVMAFIGKLVEPDAEGTSRIERVLIPKCRGFPTG